MQLPTITGLNVGFVPHRKWSLRRWLFASPIWYYHGPRTSQRIVAGRRFYELVDPLLRDLCRELNDHGLATTPSCEGHFHPPSHFRRVWEELRREEPLIGGEGLVVHDAETDEAYLFREPGYRLPWKSSQEFLQQAMRQQGIGYLGIVVPGERRQIAGTLQSICGPLGYASVLCETPLFHLFVSAGGPMQQRDAWQEITDMIRAMLHREPRVGSAATSTA